ncbi:N-acetylglucosamine-6-phosphate deacetylase [Paenibacillus chibensis]|uniref:N-acetylglucosamine-6-phosphate deacetylase n=1 Tax=Paenibacillus chibensis TaxID=59846 RepID=UPI000FDAF750|nr:amidohydrolase family protein [Paenibacillus chibensis]MEC0368417.1 amidohydrolase family protein [Paenibacillus chibensis]
MDTDDAPGAAFSLKGRHYRTGEVIELGISGSVIAECKPIGAAPDDETDEASGNEGGGLPWIAPGLVDLQINGYGGIDMNAPEVTEEDAIALMERLWAEGVTTFYPTVITGSDASLAHAVDVIHRACCRLERAYGPMAPHSIAGIHLEGPFISPEDGPRGAHDRAYVRAPDIEAFEAWQRAAGGRIRIVTLSPEWPEAEGFIARCAQQGVVAAIGHTAASGSRIEEAAAAGACLSTHLGNGAHPVLPRHPHYIWDQLADERLWASVIADGFHLPDAFLKVARKAKGDRLILVSDAVSLGGMPPGPYVTPVGGRVTLTEEGRLQLAEQPALLAGSALPLARGVAHMASAGICALGEAWDMASTGPSRLMKLPTRAGLAPGAPADVILFTYEEGRILIQETYKHGHRKYARSANGGGSRS